MRKWFSILNSVKVSEDEDMGIMCLLNFAGWMSLVTILSSFTGIMEIEAKLETDKMYSR